MSLKRKQLQKHETWKKNKGKHLLPNALLRPADINYYDPLPATASCFPHEIIVNHEKAACNTFRRSCRKYLRRIASAPEMNTRRKQEK